MLPGPNDSESAGREMQTLPWRCFTPRGVAEFAVASYARLYLTELLFGLVAMASVIWFLNRSVSPIITEALQQMPENAALQKAELINLESKTLSGGKFLSLVVDLEEQGQTGQTADLQIEFSRKRIKICSLLGCLPFNYPDGAIALGRSKSEPWWGAWRPIILAGFGLGALLSLFLSWALLAALYFPIPKMLAYFADRKLTWSGSWRLASVAQMPGAILMTLAIFIYGVNTIDLIRFLFIFGLHLIIAWIYLLIAPFFLPRIGKVAANPFVTNPAAGKTGPTQ